MAMAAALGVEPLLAAEVLPDLEAIAVRHINARMESER